MNTLHAFLAHMNVYVGFFVFSFILAVLSTIAVRRFARHVGAMDIPKDARKIHKMPMPLLGGWAVIFSFIVVVAAYVFIMHPNVRVVPIRFFIGILIGSLILGITGFLDDRFDLPPKLSVLGPLLASLSVVVSGIGIGITSISNPLGHAFNLQFMFLGIPFSAIFVFVFVMGMTYTTKFLDGMDGLASGISLIASCTLFALSLTPHINQPITASLAIIFAGSLAGFLVFNFNPASIFLGESGSTFTGFMLAALSVLLGGKIATAVLVMGVPILDIAWVIARRMWYGISPFKADRKHLHLRLLDIGYSQRKTVLILYAIAAIFGSTAVLLQAKGKLIALIILFCVMVGLGVFSVFAYKVQEKIIEDTASKS
jgi:UDP-GlcNAc:undecaprenyl-phosphate GlcNAc-1-phosphate transferase